MTLRPTQPPIQWVPGTFSEALKRQEREADHSRPCSAKVKNYWPMPKSHHGVLFNYLSTGTTLPLAFI
jgi:hypothetical protein